ncbi:hypothetical protein Pyn_06352 [Prunus yedoensis var. nudiflora]|uniref:Uncharacterized protein n=1 Tax=Prunus yedoensis var. nudiflora TaxID=2094558 RepID=A0A314UQ52_PRUYE|nr:hypothetical protein Pyn_06352 [Prunus yedoensis var. nudiflora]
MGATGVLSQMNMAKMESSYQTLPSSSIALQFLHGLIGRKVIPFQGREGISVTSWPWLTSTFQDERQLVDSGGRKAIWIRPNCHEARFNGYGSTPILERPQWRPLKQVRIEEKGLKEERSPGINERLEDI